MATATAAVRPRVARAANARGRKETGNPRILGIGTANPPHRFTQEEAYRLAGYDSQRILEIFLNSDIDTRHFYVDPEHVNRHETPDELNKRYLCGAMEIGAQAVQNCLDSAGLGVGDVDLLATCTCTGYVCPDVGTRLIGQMGFRRNVERAPLMGLGCAGALPTLQRASDYARAYPGRRVLMLVLKLAIVVPGVAYLSVVMALVSVLAEALPGLVLGQRRQRRGNHQSQRRENCGCDDVC